MNPHSIPLVPFQQVFQQLQLFLEEFFKLLVQEEVVMKRLNRENMSAVVEHKETVLEKIQRSEQQLIAVLRPWISRESAADCWKVITQDSRFADVRQLPAFQAIQRETARIRVQSQKNSVLVRRGQYVVREALNLIQTSLGQGPVYQGTGTLQIQPAPYSVNLRG